MKKLLACLFLFFPFYAPAAQLGEYAHFARVKTISSGFVMEKYLSIAVKPLISRGVFYFERPGFLRWEYFEPFPSGILLEGDKAFSWRGEGKSRRVKNVSSQPFAKIMAQQLYMFVSMDMDKINKYYTPKPLAQGLVLAPKNTSKDQNIDKITLTFTPEKDAVQEVEILETTGDKTRILFRQIKLDEPLPAALKTPPVNP